ncbi:MAG TPA: hypothetical protein VN709_00230 [Terriglobales bacterium]|nr:hypothetical protein [Terriglobales bacterium]
MSPRLVAWLAVSYALLLLGAAAAFEWTARRVHRRSEAYKTAGFTYEHELDRWRCPTGNVLRRHTADHHRAHAIYRAEAHVCNSCALKKDCTDTHEGRALEVTPDAWVGSTMERFHRGMSLILVLLAEVILVITYVTHPGPMLLIAFGVLAAIGMRLGLRFFQAIN